MGEVKRYGTSSLAACDSVCIHSDVVALERELAETKAKLEKLTQAAREVWESVPGTYSREDAIVQRHARALIGLGDVIGPMRTREKEEGK